VIFPSIFTIALLIFFTLLSGCKEQKKDGSVEKFSVQSFSPESEQKFLEFETFSVTSEKISEDITGLGSLTFCERAQVVARIDGIVEKVYIKKGDKVEKNQVIIELSNYQLELEKGRVEEDVLEAEEELETAKLQLAEEEKNLFRKFIQVEKLDLQIENFSKEIEFLNEHLLRKEKLFQRGGITEEEMRSLEFSLETKKREAQILKKERELEAYGFRDQDLLQAGYTLPEDKKEKEKLLIYMNTKLSRKRIEFAMIRLKKAKVELERINWLLGHTRIRAPITGVISDITRFTGEKVSADEPVAVITDLSRLLAKASFSESDLFTLRKCKEVFVHIDSIDREVKGKVYSIDPFIDPDTRSFYVECIINNTMGLVPGMFVKARVEGIRQRKGIFIPVECFIQSEGDMGYVYVVSKNNRIFRRQIRSKKFNHLYIEVEEGLEEGEVVVKNPLINLMDGTEIRVKQD